MAGGADEEGEERVRIVDKDEGAVAEGNVCAPDVSICRLSNDLIVRLEKEKSLQEKRDFQQNLVKENEQAVKRMTALDQWYKDKINLIQDNRK